MRRLIPLLLCLSLTVPAFASRDFTAASSQRIDLNTTLGNWEGTQAWSIACWVRMKTNVAGVIIGKQDATANVRGWAVSTAAGATNAIVQVGIQNSPSNHIVQRTSGEVLTLNTYVHLVVTYSGNGLASGVLFYVNGSSSSKAAATADNLAGNTILNSVASQIGARGGTGAATAFENAILRRGLLYNVALTAQNAADLFNEAVRPDAISGLQGWWEFGSFNDGATQVADWSGNNNWGNITGAAYSTTDPTVTSYTPNVGTSGGATLSGPLTRGGSPPYVQNLGWAGGANNGRADQIGPALIQKLAVGSYVGYFENDTGVKTLDPSNQPGAFDFDTPSIIATSSTGAAGSWTFTSQDTASGSAFNVNNLVGALTGPQTTAFKAAVQGETSLSTFPIYDPDDNICKTWFHGGNNTGPRAIYYATCSVASCGGNCATAGTWNVQNGGVAIISKGAGGTWDDGFVAAPHVVRVNSALMLMVYGGFNAAVTKEQIGWATSTDRGLTWTPSGSNPIIPVGAAGSWNATSIHPGAFFIDIPLQLLVLWIGGNGNAATDESIGYYYSPISSTPTWTAGAFNPVFNKNVATSGLNNYEDLFASSVDGFLDGTTYHFVDRADNGVGGTTGFRGRTDQTLSQVVTSKDRKLLLLKVGH
jgi:hypothetical protein